MLPGHIGGGVGRSGVVGARANETVIVVLLDDVSAPSGDATNGEDRREKIDVDADIVHHYRESLTRHQQNWHEACRRSGAIFTTIVAETLLRDWRLDDLIAADFLKVV